MNLNIVLIVVAMLTVVVTFFLMAVAIIKMSNGS